MSDPYEVLGLSEGADRLEVKQAYLRLMELYSHNSLALYSLLTDAQRGERLSELEAAYREIQERLGRQSGAVPLQAPELSPSEVLPDQETATGEFLRRTRELAGLSIKQLAERTKISPGKLTDIEAERFGRLPPAVYLRGFVREYARSLGLGNAAQLAEHYLKRLPPETEDGLP